MRYLKAYLKAWWTMWCYVSAGCFVAATILYVLGLKMDSLVLPYLLYVVSLAAVGGVVREFIEEKEKV